MARRSLIGRTAATVARTAVIAGTATAVSGAVAGRRQGAAPPPEPAAAPQDQKPAAMSADAMAQLQKLAEHRASGVLTEEEFAAQKARLLH